MHALVTGSAGFIGHALSQRLLAAGHTVTGFDGFSPYYDVGLKRARHAQLAQHPGFEGVEGRLETPGALLDVMARSKPDLVFHLAAQAGVRYSLVEPGAYVEANLVGFANLLEAVRAHPVRHLLIASTSSAYGGNASVPFRETDRAVSPLTLYAASKLANEAMAHSYAHLFRVPTTAFRFFTVYGPWGRPDMALFKFVKATLAGEPIDVYGHGKMQRDFTYVEDLVESIARLTKVPPVEGQPVSDIDSLSPAGPYRVVNIGGGQPVGLLDYVDAVEKCLGMPVKRNFLDMQKGDVPATFAAADLLEQLIDYKPTTTIDVGVKNFVEWYRSYYRV